MTSKTSVNVSSSETNKSQESDEKTHDKATVASNTLLAGGERVLLQTAQVVVCNKDGLKWTVLATELL